MAGLDTVKAATWALHIQAERSGVIADIMAARASRFALALLLRGLLPVYQVLDRSPFGGDVLARGNAIAADLSVLAPGTEVPLLPEAEAYATRVRSAGDLMVAHAYVRYLGDLNGGAVMRRRLAACIGDVAAGLRFLDFKGIADRNAFICDYRMTLDRTVQHVGVQHVTAEALVAFEMNIALSEAVKAAAVG